MKARASLEEILRRPRTLYLDWCLLYWPRAGLDIPGILDMLSRAQQDGLTRRIGVANFPLRLLRMGVEDVGAPIVCDQVDYYVLLDRTPLLGYPRAHVPLAQGRLTDLGLSQENSNRR